MGGKWVETRREECGWDGEIIGSFVKNGIWKMKINVERILGGYLLLILEKINYYNWKRLYTGGKENKRMGWIYGKCEEITQDLIIYILEEFYYSKSE